MNCVAMTDEVVDFLATFLLQREQKIEFWAKKLSEIKVDRPKKSVGRYRDNLKRRWRVFEASPSMKRTI